MSGPAALPDPDRVARRSITLLQRQGLTAGQAADVVMTAVEHAARKLDITLYGAGPWLRAVWLRAEKTYRTETAGETERNDHGR